MRKLRTGSLFSSGGGWEIGAFRAGYRPAWGVEHEAARAAVWNQTFPSADPGCMVGDVRDAELLRRATPVDVLFTSPVCRDFSVSRSRVDEANVDACRPMLGLATLNYVDALRPAVVMLENVPAYAKAVPYLRLVAGMRERGYVAHEKALNAADYGNPSSRARLFAVFVRADSGVTFAWPRPTGRVSWESALAPYLSELPPAPSIQPALKRAIAEWAVSTKAVAYPFLYVVQKQSMIDGKYKFPVGLPGRPAPTLTVGHGTMNNWRVVLSATDFRALGDAGAAALNGFLVPSRFPTAYGAGMKASVVAAIAGDAVSPIMSEALLGGLSWPAGYR